MEMKKESLFYNPKILNAKPTKAISCLLILALVLTQCPFSPTFADGTASSGGSSTPLTPFQSEFYRTDLITGTASFSVPVVVPPGRKGVQPSLALAYSSAGGNSWCGVGWNLSLGSIQRDTRKGIPQYDNTDTIIAAVSGANMKLVNIGGSEYRAKIESGFMKFLYHENDNYWEVWDKGGSKYRFGFNNDSRVTNPKGTVSWSLDEVLDTNGNYMAISYTQNQGQIYLQQVQYTGNKNTNYFPKHTVDFILEGRTDLSSNYRSGDKVVTAQRLKEIAVKTDNEWARRYVLNYEYSPDTNRSILKSVTEYGQDGETPLPLAKSFTYSERGSDTGGALYPDLVLNGGSLVIDGEKHFNSIILKNGAVLTCSPGPTGMTLIVDEFVKLESGSKIDLDGKGYAGGDGGAGGSRGGEDNDCGGKGGTKGGAGSGSGAGSGGSDGGDAKCFSFPIVIFGKVLATLWFGGGGGGGGAGGLGKNDIAGGTAGILPNSVTYDLSTVHAGAGGAGASGGGGGGNYHFANWSYGANGGRGEKGGCGGGYLKIICPNIVINSDCSLTAHGQNGGKGGIGGDGVYNKPIGGGGGGHGAGGGAGGGIYLEVAGTLTNNGIISVTGGDGGPGGLGGNGAAPGEDGLQGPGGSAGRIEIHYATKEGNGTYSYSGGSGSVNGDNGALYEEQIFQPDSLSSAHDIFQSISGANQVFADKTPLYDTADSDTGGDNLWNICFLGHDGGDENHGSVPPFATSTVYTQASYKSIRIWLLGQEIWLGPWWDIDADGDIHYGGPKNCYICAWTYLYVEAAKTISLSYYNEVDPNTGFYLSNKDNPDPYAVNKNNIFLRPGYNILYLTSYNENRSFQFEMDGGIANQVKLMNSSAIALPQPQFNLSPIMGDFNGDGRVDIGKYHKESGTWQVALANESDLFSYSTWLSGFGGSTDFEPIISDFNNDGLTDVGTYNKNNGNWAIALSDGSQFNSKGNWLTGFGADTDYLPITGDFNGDTKIDVGVYNKNTGNASIALNNSGFIPDGVWLTNFGGSDAYDVMPGDFNGDGLTDIGIHHKTSGDVAVALCNGSTFVSSGNWLAGFAANKTILTGDFNNDGLTDIGSFDKTEGLWTTALSTGSRFSNESCWLRGFGQGEYFTAHTGDFSGDGITNAGAFNWQKETWAQIPSKECPSDLLVEFSNGLGGKTTITYQPSTQYDNSGSDDFCDLPFPIQTVSSVSVEDGLGSPPNIINYSYKDGFFDFREKEFIGFGQVSVTDEEGNTAETWYNQAQEDRLYIYKGMPLKQEIKKQLSDGSTELYQQKIYTYGFTTPCAELNYFPYLSQEESSNYEAMATAKTSRVNYQYDNYGNVTRVISIGDIDTTGDEREQQTEYISNTDSWILSLPVHTWLDDADNKKVSESFYYYDSAGNLTKEESWLNTGTNPLTSYIYDDYGNILTATDAGGNITTTTYEKYYHTFPKAVTNAFGHTIQYTHDPKTGQILTSTDPNGRISTNNYDVFGRIISVFGPNDDAAHPATWYEYDLKNQPIKITTHSRVEHNTDDPNKIFTSYAFYDGLGRLSQTKSEAEDSSKQIISGIVVFNSRGQVKEKYLPYYIDIATQEDKESYSTPVYTGPKVSYQYDPLGRAVQTTTLNDKSETISSTVQYEPGSQTITDANGHKTRNTYDAYGQLIKVEEFNGQDIYTTNYTYDFQGNLTQTIDDKGNISSINYDSLGRKISMDDPDMGEWNYDYDINGNLIKQTDAKGQIVQFEYDSLNRLTQKILSSTTSSIVTYIYDDPTKPDYIGRLSKIIDSSGQTEFFYDNLGRETKTIKTIDDTAYIVERAYDALGRLILVTYPNSKDVDYTYNRQGGIETVTTPDGSISNIDYTVSGQIKLIQYSNGTQTQYSYNSNTLRLSQLTTISSSATLQNLSYSFDNLGNVSNITDNSPQGTNTQSFQYDDLSRLIQAAGESYGTIDYQYDSIGNMLQKGSQTLTYGEGEAGPHAVTSLRRGPDEAIPITYDANGNMLNKGETKYQYDIENRLIQTENFPVEQTSAIEIPLETGWNFISIPLILEDYSCASVLSSIAGKYKQVIRYNTDTKKFKSFIDNPKFDQFSEFTYGEGYLVYITEPCILSLTGTLDHIPLTLDLKEGWNLIASPTTEDEIPVEDALNNLVHGEDYDTIAEYNGTSFTYNPDTLKRGKSYYVYVLKDITWEIPVENRKTTTAYAYDGDGGRVKKWGLSPEGTVPIFSTTYIGSLFEVRETSEGTTYVNHIFNGSNRAFSIETSDTETHTYFYHQDHIGSSNVVSNETGTQDQLLEYTPYGLTSRVEGNYNTNYRFTGKEYDSSNTLCYYGARYYDPDVGRFISADPTVQQPGDPQTFNRYSYCRNNPIRYVDPTGYGWFLAFLIAAFITAFAEMAIHVFNIQGTVAKIIRIAAAAVSAFAGGVHLGLQGVKLGTSVISAAGTSATLQTGVGRKMIRGFAKQLQEFGINMRVAYMMASTITYATVNSIYNMGLSLATQPKAGAGVVRKEISQDTWMKSERYAELRANEGTSGGFWGRGSNVSTTAEAPGSKLFEFSTPEGNLLGVEATAPLFGGSKILGPMAKMLHINHSSFAGYGVNGGFVNSMANIAAWEYGTLTVCHQSTNIAAGNAGIPVTTSMSTIGISSVVSTMLYGNYGNTAGYAAVEGTAYYEE
jgi:RHS repeat-associated protein